MYSFIVLILRTFIINKSKIEPDDLSTQNISNQMILRLFSRVVDEVSRPSSPCNDLDRNLLASLQNNILCSAD